MQFQNRRSPWISGPTIRIVLGAAILVAIWVPYWWPNCHTGRHTAILVAIAQWVRLRHPSIVSHGPGFKTHPYLILLFAIDLWKLRIKEFNIVVSQKMNFKIAYKSPSGLRHAWLLLQRANFDLRKNLIYFQFLKLVVEPYLITAPTFKATATRPPSTPSARARSPSRSATPTSARWGISDASETLGITYIILRKPT